jgi:hypothetical protein
MLVASTVVLLLLQQETPLAGRVLDGAGAPAANATVTLLHRPIPRHCDPAREHRVVVATDARGAFKAALRDGARYSAWAATATAASAIEEGVDGGFVELHLLDGTGPRTVAVEGLDAWREAATFRWRAVVGGEHVDFAPVAFAAGAVTLPPLPPFASRNVEVLRADGEVLWASNLPHDAALQVPPPREHAVRVTDPAGAPIAGVEVLAHVRNYWATCSAGVEPLDRFLALWPVQGRSDDRGELVVRVPERSGAATRLWLLAQKDGWRGSLDGVLDGKRFAAGVELAADAQPARDAPAAPFAIVLQRADPIALRVRTQGGEPLGDGQLYLFARANVKKPRGGTGTMLHLALPLTDGLAQCAAPPDGVEIESAWTTLSPARRAALRERLGFAPPSVLRLPASGPITADAVPVVDLDGWRELRVVAADGRPAARTVVRIRLRGGDGARPHDGGDGRSVLLRTDRLGRLALPPGAVHAAVLAAAGTGTIELPEGPLVPWQLAAAPVLSGVVIDAAGAPVAGASVTTATRGSSTPPELRDVAALLQLQTAPPTGADGRFRLLLPAATLALTVNANTAGNGSARQELDVEAGAPPPVLELRTSR